MIRMIGAAMVAVGGAWLGFQGAEDLRSRVRTLRQVSAGLAVLERELELNGPPLAQLLNRGSEHSVGMTSNFFQSCAQGLEHLDREEFSSQWRRQVAQFEALGRQGQEILSPLGDVLGRYDVQQQRRGTQAVRSRLEELADMLERECRRQGRVCQALGISGGAFLVILLL